MESKKRTQQEIEAEADEFIRWIELEEKKKGIKAKENKPALEENKKPKVDQSEEERKKLYLQKLQEQKRAQEQAEQQNEEERKRLYLQKLQEQKRMQEHQQNEEEKKKEQQQKLLIEKQALMMNQKEKELKQQILLQQQQIEQQKLQILKQQQLQQQILLQQQQAQQIELLEAQKRTQELQLLQQKKLYQQQSISDSGTESAKRKSHHDKLSPDASSSRKHRSSSTSESGKNTDKSSDKKDKHSSSGSSGSSKRRERSHSSADTDKPSRSSHERSNKVQVSPVIITQAPLRNSTSNLTNSAGKIPFVNVHDKPANAVPFVSSTTNSRPATSTPLPVNAQKGAVGFQDAHGDSPSQQHRPLKAAIEPENKKQTDYGTRVENKARKYDTTNLLKKKKLEGGIKAKGEQGQQLEENYNDAIKDVAAVKQMQALHADMQHCKDDEERRRKEAVLRVMAKK